VFVHYGAAIQCTRDIPGSWLYYAGHLLRFLLHAGATDETKAAKVFAVKEAWMSHAPLPSTESESSKKPIVSGLVALFAIYFAVSFYVQTIVAARPRMAADLDGMALYSWSISVPTLAVAFATLLLSKHRRIRQRYGGSHHHLIYVACRHKFYAALPTLGRAATSKVFCRYRAAFLSVGCRSGNGRDPVQPDPPRSIWSNRGIAEFLVSGLFHHDDNRIYYRQFRKLESSVSIYFAGIDVYR
jgi:hypothetical protein